MNRCNTISPSSLPRRGGWLASVACAALLGAALVPAIAQVPGGMGQNRNFPQAALRGTLTVQDGAMATLNGQPIRMAPGMRLFSPQNALVMRHTVQGQPLKVNYVIETSTGMLLTAWILTQAEADRPRQGSDTTTSNIRTEVETKPALLR